MPSFRLPDADGAILSSEQFRGAAGLLVIFICPHCPFVRHIRSAFAQFAREYQSRGLPIVAINSNDISALPEDSREGTKKDIEEAGYSTPYLFYESQAVAKAFRAECTPDLFLFGRGGKLVYLGQFDDSRAKSHVPITGADIRAAADAVLEGRTPFLDQKSSIGCNIKWKPGNEPEYA